MAGPSSGAAIVENSPHQNGGRVRDVRMPFQGTFGQPGLDGVEPGAVEDRLMLAGMNFTTVGHVADVEAVLEEMRQGANAVSPPPMDRPLEKVRTFEMMFRRPSSWARAPTEPHSR